MNIWNWVLIAGLVEAVVFFVLGRLVKEEGFDFIRFRLRRALINDDNGDYVGKARINPNNSTFRYKNRTFVYVPEDATITKIKTLFYDVWYYHYNINNPFPLRLKREVVIPFDSKRLDIINESKVLKDMNDFNRPSFFGNIKFVHVVIFLVIIGVAYWLFTGHTLTGGVAPSLPAHPLNVSR